MSNPSEASSAGVEKNSGKIQCQFCGSVILLPNSATLLEVSEGILLPPLKSSEQDTEKTYKFWTVSDMFDFENVGFCNTVDDVKYLACADCDIGPIGAHFLNDKKKFYVSPSRVKHDLSEQDQANDKHPVLTQLTSADVKS